MLTKGWPTDCHQLSSEGSSTPDVCGLATILDTNLRTGALPSAFPSSLT